ncbi:MAG: class I SAM-dependent methyltransferase [Nitrospirae bacterium]|nr:class I SAM-dependent methyltransferase [Nitrospirota bacterium]
MSGCLVCGNNIEPFMSFGQMPLANGFLPEERFSGEYFYELSVAFCPNCTMVQLVRQPAAGKMFHDEYAFFSGTSAAMAVHFERFASRVISKFPASDDPFVVEIGCNDGIMLRHFADAGIRHLGIEPSENVARAANAKGVRTISRFFGEDLARDIVREHGRADAFLGANVMCHIAGINSVIRGIKTLLKPDGIAMFEDPYLGDVIEKTSYDQIYDEHVFLFSLSSVQYAFAQHGMELIDIEPQTTHGGSMRYLIAHKGARNVSGRVAAQLKTEDEMGLNRAETFDAFRKRCEESRDALKTLLSRLKGEGRRIVGYAATSKSTTILNYCDIDSSLLEFISDTTPIKQGKFSPGMHIPVRPYRDFVSNYPDYALLLAWNHSEEIMAKEELFRDAGGKWIVFVPRVRVIE